MTREAPTFFRTPRLRVRGFTGDDVETFLSYRANPEVARYQSWTDDTLERGHAFVESLQGIEPGGPGQWFPFALEARSSGTLVGDLALQVDAEEPRQAALGFTLDRAHQGEGYATEALCAFLDCLFPTFRLHRIIAVTDALKRPGGPTARARGHAPGGPREAPLPMTSYIAATRTTTRYDVSWVRHAIRSCHRPPRMTSTVISGTRPPRRDRDQSRSMSWGTQVLSNQGFSGP